ncbi:MAG: FAD-dependent oxidoreductase [Thermoanaerobaculia bacterium]|jgi:predicted NAD/FAD-binding protein
MKIAVIGTGISGLVSAYLLSRDHEVTVFEANDYVGGHTVTTQVESAGTSLAVDAGFIVYNEASYPNFVRLLDQLGVESQPTSMSFSVRCDRTGLEYAGTNLNTLFAQRSNLLRPRYYLFTREILRFNKAAKKALSRNMRGTLGDFLAANNLSPSLAELYVIPLTAAIWSTEPQRALETPARFILRFLDNHRLLGTIGYHTWRVIKGGSQRYVEKLIVPFADRIRLRTPVYQLERSAEGVRVSTADGPELFDEVIVAAHSDQALKMLASPSPAEEEILGSIGYQKNRAILHSDDSVLPRTRRAWASWNYRTPADPDLPVAVTYNMTQLQSLPTEKTYCTSLNLENQLDERSTIARFSFEHPLFTEAAVASQSRHTEISGTDRIHYCGAYWRHGFHEDGVVSALAVGKRFGVSL